MTSRDGRTVVRVQLFADLLSGGAAEKCDAVGDVTPLTSPPSGKIKLTLTPELRQLPIGFKNRQYSSFGEFRLVSAYGFGYPHSNRGPRDTAGTLEEAVELVGESVPADRYRFDDIADGLKCEAVQLEEKIYRKSAEIEHLQLYNSEKLKIINSLIAALNETEWKRDTMQRICEEHAPDGLYKSMAVVSRVTGRRRAFESARETLRSCADSLKTNGALRDVLGRLASGLDECIGAADKAASRELSDALLDGKRFNGTVEEIIRDFPGARWSETAGHLRTVAVPDRRRDGGGGGGRNNLENLIELWEMVKNLTRSNKYLANRVTSMNMHKVSLQYQLDEMENNTRELELKTITETERVQQKQETLNHNESMIQQHWDELDTSQKIVAQTQRAQDIDQKLEDLQMEYDNHDKEYRQLKTDLCYFETELAEYRTKCEQLETETKQIEAEKNDVLEAYAKSWGHHNSKQKIKYTGRLIKEIDCINQENKSLETAIQEFEKHDRGAVNAINNSNNDTAVGTRTPVFGRTQPKSEKTPQTPKTCGAVDSTKRQNQCIFRESVVCKLRYQ